MTRGSTLNIQFKVDAHASCIRVMSIDCTGICVATAKLACDIDATGVDYPTVFTVSSSILKTCLKTLKFHHSLDIVLHSDTLASKLVLIAYKVSSSITTNLNCQC